MTANKTKSAPSQMLVIEYRTTLLC